MAGTRFEKPPEYYWCDRIEMLAFIPPTAKRILDVGCAGGHFGAHLKASRGAHVWGVELHPGVAKEAEQRLDSVLQGPYPAVLEGKGLCFDCVVFNDVLEHMIDPWSALAQTKKYLVSGGRVVASIPNVRYLPHLFKLAVRGEWRYTTSGLLDRTHLRFFTRRSILEMFTDAGFLVERIRGVHHAKHWQASVIRYLFPGLWREVAPLEFAVVARVPGPYAKGDAGAIR